MGVIQRQSFKNSLVGLLGVLIGAIATMFIYPKALEAYGLVRFLVDTSTVLSPILILGIHSLPLKFYPVLKDEGSADHGFLSFLLFLLMIVLLVTCLVFIPIEDFLVNRLFSSRIDNDLLRSNIRFILPLAAIGGISLFFTQYINVFRRITVPSIFNNLFLKIGTVIIILLFLYGSINIDQISIGILFVLITISLGLIMYLIFLGKFRLATIDFGLYKRMRHDLISYSFFSILGTVGYLIAFRIDSIMVSTLVGLSDNGAYNIGLFIGASISIPDLAVRSISAPIVSEWIVKSDLSKVENLYKKTSINLLIIGVGLFVLIICSLPDLLTLLPSDKEFASLYQIVLFLGLARLVDMSMGIKNQIILYSNYYRFALYTIILLAVSNVFFNLIFIKYMDLGVVGAAFATCVSFLLVNLVYFVFIYSKFSMQPFSFSTLRLILVSILVFVLGFNLALGYHPFVNIIIRSCILLVLYIILIYNLRISEDSRNLIRSSLNKIRLF